MTNILIFDLTNAVSRALDLMNGELEDLDTLQIALDGVRNTLFDLEQSGTPDNNSQVVLARNTIMLIEIAAESLVG